MSTDASDGRQGDLPPDGAPHGETEPVADAYGTDIWGADFSDPTAGNFFSAEIEDVDASDWDVDTAQIWGDETDHGGIDDGGLMGADFPL